MKESHWNVQITSCSECVTSMNGVTIKSQQPLEFVNTADVVLFGSGALTRDIVQDNSILLIKENRLIEPSYCKAVLLCRI